MTYEEWVTKYEYYEQPEDGWRLCDYDRAERATMAREELREEYPEYLERYYGEAENETPG